jgi:two-component system, chemotaxis family, sensor kinase Cph1
MSNTEIVTLQAVDLTNCEREPIHIPGRIQPHGVLLVLQEPEYTRLQVSANTDVLLGIPAEDLLGRNLNVLLAPQQIEQLRAACSGERLDANALYLLTLQINDRPERFDTTLHRIQGVLVLELEPAASQAANTPDYYALIRKAVPCLQNARNVEDLSCIAAEQVRQFSGFDRVMVYKFDDDGHGQVIAESKRDDLEPFLGLHYPASDIPQQARWLYMLNLLRLIADVGYTPAELIPTLNPLTGKTLDMTYSLLRSVSPIHLEYLKNMGVAASMSISLVQNDQLWGLIACHHTVPHHLPYYMRANCELLGQVVSMQLSRNEEYQDSEYRNRIQTIQAQLVQFMTEANEFQYGLVDHVPNLLSFIDAGGAAVCIKNTCSLLGNTPDEAFVRRLVEWLAVNNDRNVFATDHLSAQFSEAAIYQEVGSGLLALTISREERAYLLWFRPEVIRTVAWSGNPNKPAEIADDGSLRLTPRKSFKLWQEQVKNRSWPWKRIEIEAVQELRRALIGVVLRRAEELARLNTQLTRSNTELDAFVYISSHDLKEPLRGIHNYAYFLKEDYGEILDAEGQAKLDTLMRLTLRMEALIDTLLHYSRVGQLKLNLQTTDLNVLLRDVLEVLQPRIQENDIEIRIPHLLPQVECDPLQLAEVFSNLIINSIKYSEKHDKWIEIGTTVLPADRRTISGDEDRKSGSSVVIYVQDNGIGIREKHYDTIFRIFKRLHGRDEYGGGTGAGLTIARKIVERHGGSIWVQSIYSVGTTFYFTLET